MATVKVYIQLRVDGASPTWVDISTRCEYDNLEWEQNDQGTAAVMRVNMFTMLPKSTLLWSQYPGATDAAKLQNAVNDHTFLLPFTDHAEIQVRDVSTTPHSILFGGLVTVHSTKKDGGFIAHDIEATDYTELLNEVVVQYFYPPVNSTAQQVFLANDTQFSVTNKVKSKNVATLTLSSVSLGSPYSRNLMVNDYIYVSIGDSKFDGYWRIRDIDTNSKKVSYSVSGDNVSSTSASGTATVLSLFGTIATPRSDSRIGRYLDNIFDINPNFKIRKKLTDGTVDPINFGGRTLRQAIDAIINRVGGTYWLDAGVFDNSYNHTISFHFADTNPKNYGDSDDSVNAIISRTRVNDLVTLKLESVALGRPYSRNLQSGDSVTILTGYDTFDGVKTLTAVNTTDNTISYTSAGNNVAANTVSITGATSASGNTTYTAKHSFSLGQIVDITGISPSGFNKSNQTITQYTDTTFTVATSSSGTYSSGGTATARGYTVTAVSGNGAFVTYTVDNGLKPGDYVVISGITPSAYNRTIAKVYSATSTQFVVQATTTSTYTSGGTVKIVAEESGGTVSMRGMSGIFDGGNTAGYSLGSGNTLVASSGPYSTGYSIRCDGGGGGPFEVLFTQAARIPVVPGEKWWFSVKAKSSSHQKAHLYVKYYNSSQVYLSEAALGAHLNNDDSWEVMYDIHEIPAGVAYISPVAHTDSGANTAYYTDFKVIKINGAFGFHEYPSAANVLRADNPESTSLAVNTYDFEKPDAPTESGQSANRLYLYTMQTVNDGGTSGLIATNTKSTYTSVQGVWQAGGKIIEIAAADERASTLDLSDMKAKQYFDGLGQTIQSYAFDHIVGPLVVGSVVPFIWPTAGIREALVVRSQKGYLIGQEVYYNVQLGGDPKFQKNSIYLIDRQILQSTNEEITLHPVTSDDSVTATPPNEQATGPLEIPSNSNAATSPNLSVYITWDYDAAALGFKNFGGFRIRYKSKTAAGVEDAKWTHITPVGVAATSSTEFYHSNLTITKWYKYSISALDASTGAQTAWSTETGYVHPGPVTANAIDPNTIEINDFVAGVKPVAILTKSQADVATVANGYDIGTMAVITSAVTYTYSSGTAAGTTVTIPAGSVWKRTGSSETGLINDWAPGDGLTITTDNLIAGKISAGIIAGGALTLSGLTGGSYAIQSSDTGTRTFSVTASGNLQAAGATFNPNGRSAVTLQGSATEGDIAVPTGNYMSIGHISTTAGAGTFVERARMSSNGNWTMFKVAGTGGNLTVEGDLSVTGALTAGSGGGGGGTESASYHVTGTADATSKTAGAPFLVDGGAGIAKTLWANNVKADATVSAQNLTASSAITGATLEINGGPILLGKNSGATTIGATNGLNIDTGGAVTINNSTESNISGSLWPGTGAFSGSLLALGGISIQKSLKVGLGFQMGGFSGVTWNHSSAGVQTSTSRANLYWDNANNRMSMVFPNSTGTPSLFVDGGFSFSGSFSPASIALSSTTEGAFGGISGAVVYPGPYSSSTGSLRVAGGAAITKSLWVGSGINVQGGSGIYFRKTDNSSGGNIFYDSANTELNISTDTTVSGQIKSSTALLGTTNGVIVSSVGKLSVQNSDAATSATVGALMVTGGIAVAKKSYMSATDFGGTITAGATNGIEFYDGTVYRARIRPSTSVSGRIVIEKTAASLVENANLYVDGDMTVVGTITAGSTVAGAQVAMGQISVTTYNLATDTTNPRRGTASLTGISLPAGGLAKVIGVASPSTTVPVGATVSAASGSITTMATTGPSSGVHSFGAVFGWANNAAQIDVYVVRGSATGTIVNYIIIGKP